MTVMRSLVRRRKSKTRKPQTTYRQTLKNNPNPYLLQEQWIKPVKKSWRRRSIWHEDWRSQPTSTREDPRRKRRRRMPRLSRYYQEWRSSIRYHLRREKSFSINKWTRSSGKDNWRKGCRRRVTLWRLFRCRFSTNQFWKKCLTIMNRKLGNRMKTR